MYQTIRAKNFWDDIPGNIQMKLLNNVWCSGELCKGTTSIAVESMNVEKGDLILRGKCTRCGGDVARLIEGEESIESNIEIDKVPELLIATLDQPDITKQVEFRARTKLGNKVNKVEKIKIKSSGTWNPKEHFFEVVGCEQEELEHPFDKILFAGERPIWEMENIMPGDDPEDIDCPIGKGIDIFNSGDWYGAVRHMKDLLRQDERCLDAYAHLGNWYFEYDDDLNKAKNFYKTGVAIGLKSISSKIDDVFLWGLIDNRPFLRCLHGLGLTFYKQGKPADALPLFLKMIWFNPSDNQGARFLVDSIMNGKRWEELEN